jgi:acrylyl-CoA reductase (NADPH)/3-hydroxypropionyl-CoA dehydratase/3-hydroxypropionyl-CoA synthetase
MVASPAVPPRANPLTDSASWTAMRNACIADPGGFHGDQARSSICWYLPDLQAWGYFDRDAGAWTGWDATTGAPLSLDLPADYNPWERGLNADNPPNWRWFEGAFTNSGFNEVDRHVLAGHGAETALIFEGDRWNMSSDNGRGGPVDCYPVSRKQLMLEAAKCSLALAGLGLKAGDRIALNMPSIPAQIYWTEGAKRAGIIYTPVFGGFSDKTLSDRIADAGARIVITADGSYRNAQMVPFKTSYTDPALDNFIGVGTAMDLLAGALNDPANEADDKVRGAITDAVTELLGGEVTVERSDVMRGVGRALDDLAQGSALNAAQSANLRMAIASALVDSPPRVEAVVVVRHTAQPDLVWNA